MANITRRGERPSTTQPWDPLRRMRELFDWDPFAEMLPYRGGAANEFVPSFEVKETRDGYIFKADLPGVRDEDLDISLTGNRLTISGTRQSEERHEEERYYAYECGYGAFSRSFTLPEGADAEHASAGLKDGVLTVNVPRKPETQPRKIELGGRAAGDKSKAKA